MKDLLKNARIEKGLKITEVARLLKIDGALISKFESGDRTPTRNQLRQLAGLLQIDAQKLEIEWLKDKILSICSDNELSIPALKAALADLDESVNTEVNVMPSFQKLMDEMESLKSVLKSSNKGNLNS